MRKRNVKYGNGAVATLATDIKKTFGPLKTFLKKQGYSTLPAASVMLEIYLQYLESCFPKEKNLYDTFAKASEIITSQDVDRYARLRVLCDRTKDLYMAGSDEEDLAVCHYVACLPLNILTNDNFFNRKTTREFLANMEFIFRKLRQIRPSTAWFERLEILISHAINA